MEDLWRQFWRRWRRGVTLIFAFEQCELDLDRYQLRRGGVVQAVEPQVFDVLAVLIRERGRVVPKDELLAPYGAAGS